MTTAVIAVQATTIPVVRPRRRLRRRATGRHRCLMTRAELKAEVRRLEHELDGAGLYIARILADRATESGDLERTRCERDVLDRAFDKALRRMGDMEEVALEAARQQGFTIDVPAGRDLRWPDDRPTVPRGVDVSEVREEFADDYLDLRRQAWRPAPVQQPPVKVPSVTVLALDLTDGPRFAGTATVARSTA